MNKEKLTRQLELLCADLEKCDRRCKRISKECGIESNELISYAVEQTKLVLEYIENLKGEEQ